MDISMDLLRTRILPNKQEDISIRSLHIVMGLCVFLTLTKQQKNRMVFDFDHNLNNCFTANLHYFGGKTMKIIHEEKLK